MSSTTVNKPAKVATRAKGLSTPKFSGERFAAVTPEGVRFYLGEGVALDDAVRLAEGMVAPARVARIEEDGSLVLGNVLAQTRGYSFTALAA